MTSINLADAKARLSELIDRAQRGEEIEITRRGKPVVRLAPVTPEKKRIDVRALRALTEGQPMQPEGAGEFMRKLRDDYRY